MSNLESLIFYIFSFFIAFIFYYLYNKKGKKLFLFFSFIIPLVIGGFRYNVGTDFLTYKNMYLYSSKVDIGFILFSYIAKLFNNFQVLIFLYTFTTLLFIMFGLNNIEKKYRPLAYLCYLFLYFTGSFNIIRQALAVAIIFYAYKYIIDKEFKKWLLFCILAYIFHDSAIFCVPFYFVVNSRKKSLKIIIAILTFMAALNYVSILKYLTQYQLFSHFAGRYIDEYTGVTANNYSFYLELIILIYILLFRKKLINSNKSNSIYIYLLIISLILDFTGFFNPFVKRISNYFGVCEILLLSQIPNLCFTSKNKLLNYVIIGIYILSKFIISVYILKQANIIPYNFLGGC